MTIFFHWFNQEFGRKSYSGGFNAGMLATVWVTSHLMQSGGVAPPDMPLMNTFPALPRCLTTPTAEVGPDDDSPGLRSRGMQNSSCDVRQEVGILSSPLSPSQSSTSQVKFYNNAVQKECRITNDLNF